MTEVINMRGEVVSDIISNVVKLPTAPEVTEGKHRVSVIEDDGEKYPALYLEVWVEGPPEDTAGFAEMFAKCRCTKAVSPEEADIVVFTGGPDVNPIYYGARRHEMTLFDSERDSSDLKLYGTCLALGIPMFGVCRGAQFLHVMNGGSLYQHVDRHNVPHSMYDPLAKRMIKSVSSVHHQMCIKQEGMVVLGDSFAASNRWTDGVEPAVVGTKMDVEAYFYPETLCYGVQGHPEYKGFTEYTLWCLERMEDLLTRNPDTEVRKNNVRLKQTLIDERNTRWEEAADGEWLDEAYVDEPPEEGEFGTILEMAAEAAKKQEEKIAAKPKTVRKPRVKAAVKPSKELVTTH